MNSAPVQMLPINIGNEYKNISGYHDKLVESDHEFYKDFESATKEISDKSKEADDSSLLHAYNEYKDDEEKSLKLEQLKTQKEELKADSDKESASETEIDGAEIQLSNSILKEAEIEIDDKEDVISFDDTTEKKQKKKIKFSLKNNAKNLTKNGIETVKTTKFGEEIKKNDKDKSNISNVNAVDDIKSTVSNVSEKKGKTELPSIQLELASNFVEKTNVKEDHAEEKSLNKVKSKKMDSKLKINDQRKLSLVNHEKANESNSNKESLFSKTVDAAGKDVDINSADNTYRVPNRIVDIKNVQSAVGSQLKETVNNEIVKQAGIILKENGTGEIKLVMKPESLGKVRIHLSLSDNNIAGRIIVENNIVREIFESNLENLYKAFGSEGFENGGLEVSVQGEGGNTGGNRKKNRQGIEHRQMQIVQNSIAEISDAVWANNAVNMIV